MTGQRRGYGRAPRHTPPARHAAQKVESGLLVGLTGVLVAVAFVLALVVLA